MSSGKATSHDAVESESAIDQYLADAAVSGCLYGIRDLRYVASYWTDPVCGEELCYIEYAEASLLAGDGLAALTRCVSSDFPHARHIVVRAPARLRLSRPWRATVSYVRADRPDILAHKVDPSVTVAQATSQHTPMLEKWIARAISDGYADLQMHVAVADVRAAAQELLNSADRRSFIGLIGVKPVGHATISTEGRDPITGCRFVELTDVLVEPGPHRKVATDALVSAAADEAAKISLPLIGHVIHPLADALIGQRILASLLRDGWRLDHVLWRSQVPQAQFEHSPQIPNDQS